MNILASAEVRELVGGKINELRKRLLDGTRRNPLINVPFRPNSTTVIRVVDEVPDILRYNLVNGQEMRLIALPPLEEELPDEQTDTFLNKLFVSQKSDKEYLANLETLDPVSDDYESSLHKFERELKDRIRDELGLPKRQTSDNTDLSQHATNHGINPSYILPSSEQQHALDRHTDLDIQTLLLPDKLNRTAKSVVEKGKSFERETGVNVLHVAFGLLDWKNPGEKAGYKSPLLLLEIKLERRQSVRGPEFFICGIESLAINTTLKQKLISEHKIELPDLEDESVEDYLKKIDDMKPPGWDWKTRREVIVGIFPSSRIAMYHDINPDKKMISQSEIIANLLATAGSAENSYAEVYETDDPKIARQVPFLVMDADASQYSALVDVANEKNLSIEGPPGTGKSQTIVNIIASALADNKKVLFVAEKLTALEVVRSRLQSVGLGEFILPLQAGRSTRESVYESIEERLIVEEANLEAAERHKDKQDVLARKRAGLQKYLDTLSTEFYQTGFNVYQILGRAIHTEAVIKELPKDIRRLSVQNCENLSKDHIGDILDDAQAFCDRFSSIQEMPKLWLKSNKDFLSRDNVEDVQEIIFELINNLPELEKVIKKSELGIVLNQTVFEADYSKITSELEEISKFISSCGVEKLDFFIDKENRDTASKLASIFQQQNELTDNLSSLLTNYKDPLVTNRLNAASEFLSKHGLELDVVKLEGDLRNLTTSNDQIDKNLQKLKDVPAIWRDRANIKISQLKKEAADLAEFSAPVNGLRTLDEKREARNYFNQITASLSSLNKELEQIREDLPKAGDHTTSQIGNLCQDIKKAGTLSFFSSSFKQAKRFYSEQLMGDRDASKQEMLAALGRYLGWLDRKKTFSSNDDYRKVFGFLFEGVDTDLSAISEAVDRFEICQKISNGNFALEKYLLQDDINEIFDVKDIDPYFYNFNVSDLLEKFNDQRDDITTLENVLQEAKEHLALFKSSSALDASKIKSALADLNTLNNLEVPSSEKTPAIFEELDLDKIYAYCKFGSYVSSSENSEFYISAIKSGKIATLITSANELSASISDIGNKLKELDRLLDFKSEFTEISSFLSNLDLFKVASEKPDLLLERGKFKRVEEKVRSHGFSELLDYVIAQRVEFEIEKLPSVIDALIAKSMADRCMELHSEALNDYDGRDFLQIRREIAEKDRELLETSRAAAKASIINNSNPPQGNRIGRKSSYTGMGLIYNELHKKRNRVGIRELTRRAGTALFELKPCWMMSPLAVSQYAQEDLKFDLVVIDEASQMTPENAIGAIARAKQIVVVGDTKQLPPTPFFRKVIDDEDVDEDLREDSESILDLANMAFMPIRQLRWHYRSRHSALIEYSNQMMYKGELTIFPNANEDNEDLGVELIEVNGFYLNRRNEIEAKEIVDAAIEHMEKKPQFSLGICTMNVDQKYLIEEEFERIRDRNKKVQEYCEKWEIERDGLESFFIKNLETIQGDERDYMFISTLYGPEPNSKKVLQRFTQINSAHGHRRLNVLFSRAKYKIKTFSSMKPTDIIVDGAKNFGVKMLSGWLEYSKTGHVANYASTGGVTESPFEDHVAQQIELLGCEVVPQVGVAGFRIDLGVKHPEWPYGFLLGVECDGATYHSSKSSRDRDRLRQEVLEGLDWKLHRIWSTDWFKNPKAEVEALKNRINEILSEVKKNDGKTREDKVLVEANDNESSRTPEKAEQLDKLLAVHQDIKPGLLAKVGSKLKLKSLKDDKKFLFELVEGSNNPSDGKVGIHTAMGQELLDCEEGDVVQIQNGPYLNEVEVISIDD